MRPSLQCLKKRLFCRGCKNLRRGRQSQQEFLQHFEVELGVDVVEKKERRLIESPAKKSDFRELEKQHDHFLFTARQNFVSGSSFDVELDRVTLRTNERHTRANLIATNTRELLAQRALVTAAAITHRDVTGHRRELHCDLARVCVARTMHDRSRDNELIVPRIE